MPAHYDPLTHKISRIGSYPSTYNGISGFNKCQEYIKEANGWYLCNYINASFDNENEKRSDPVLSFNATTKRIDISYTISIKSSIEYDIDLQAEKDRISNMISQYRDSKAVSGFTSNDITYDSDAGSLFKINTAVIGALATGTSFTINWTAKDNSVIALDYNGILLLAIDLTSYGNLIHEEARSWKDIVSSASNYSDLRAFTSGWIGYSQSKSS